MLPCGLFGRSGGIFACGEYICTLRLTSKLVDLRVRYANSLLFHRTFRVWHHNQKARRGAYAPLWAFWSKWRDSELRRASSATSCSFAIKTDSFSLQLERIFSPSNPTNRKAGFSPCFSIGRSGGTRTRGLQFPKLARYHLRYTS